MSEQHKVVVIGGGYAGTLAANRLRMRADLDVTLVNPRPKFVERIRLHQHVARTGDVTIDYGTLLGEGIELVVDSVTRIDTASRTVELASGGALDYDYVIYAVGSTGATPVDEFAYSIADYESAERLRARLDELPMDAPVTVVGGGFTGIETAAELAERGRTVTLVCSSSLAPTLSTKGRRYVAKWLADHGVVLLEHHTVTKVHPDTVVLDPRTVTKVRPDTVVLEPRRATKVGADSVVLDGGTIRPSALTIWTTGFGVPKLAAASGLQTDAIGRLITDETLTSVDDERIVAAGDSVAPSGRPLRMSTYAAGPLGAQAADTVLSRIAGTEPAPLELRFSGACISLGRDAGIRQLARKDDTAVNLYIPGRLGARVKEKTCRFVIDSRIRREARNPGSMTWPKAGPRQNLLTQ